MQLQIKEVRNEIITADSNELMSLSSVFNPNVLLMLIELNLLHIMAISIQELCKYIHARFGTSGNMGRNQRSHNNYGLEEVLLSWLSTKIFVHCNKQKDAFQLTVH